jgi:hypothetical protein
VRSPPPKKEKGPFFQSFSFLNQYHNPFYSPFVYNHNYNPFFDPIFSISPLAVEDSFEFPLTLTPYGSTFIISAVHGSLVPAPLALYCFPPPSPLPHQLRQLWQIFSSLAVCNRFDDKMAIGQDPLPPPPRARSHTKQKQQTPKKATFQKSTTKQKKKKGGAGVGPKLVGMGACDRMCCAGSGGWSTALSWGR